MYLVVYSTAIFLVMVGLSHIRVALGVSAMVAAALSLCPWRIALGSKLPYGQLT